MSGRSYLFDYVVITPLIPRLGHYTLQIFLTSKGRSDYVVTKVICIRKGEKKGTVLRFTLLHLFRKGLFGRFHFTFED